MHRLFSGFPRGRPAFGLLLMRLTMALAILGRPGSAPAEIGAAVLVLGGVWTPVASTFIAAIEGWRTMFLAGGLISALLAAMAVTLGLVGPGSWSADARFFGWRRIDIPGTPKSRGPARSS